MCLVWYIRYGTIVKDHHSHSLLRRKRFFAGFSNSFLARARQAFDRITNRDLVRGREVRIVKVQYVVPMEKRINACHSNLSVGGKPAEKMEGVEHSGKR